MGDDSTTTITAVFKTREAADLAVEHLVQQHSIARPDIFTSRPRLRIPRALPHQAAMSLTMVVRAAMLR